MYEFLMIGYGVIAFAFIFLASIMEGASPSDEEIRKGGKWAFLLDPEWVRIFFIFLAIFNLIFAINSMRLILEDIGDTELAGLAGAMGSILTIVLLVLSTFMMISFLLNAMGDLARIRYT